MNHQFVAGFFQLDNAFIGIYYLFQENSIFAYMGKRMVSIIVFIQFI